MGSCAAPSAKGDDKFITTDYLQQCRVRHIFKPISYLEIQLLSGVSGGYITTQNGTECQYQKS